MAIVADSPFIMLVGQIQLLTLNGRLYLGGVWLDVDLRMDNKTRCLWNRLDYVFKIC